MLLLTYVTPMGCSARIGLGVANVASSLARAAWSSCGRLISLAALVLQMSLTLILLRELTAHWQFILSFDVGDTSRHLCFHCLVVRALHQLHHLHQLHLLQLTTTEDESPREAEDSSLPLWLPNIFYRGFLSRKQMLLFCTYGGKEAG